MSVSFPTKCFLFLEIFRVFEYNAQNLNTLQNNSVSWDLQMGFNSAFKGLKKPKHLIKLPISVNIEGDQMSEDIVSEVQEDFS
jgi:hypothetical protein